jgi:hypothetical protein
MYTTLSALKRRFVGCCHGCVLAISVKTGMADDPKIVRVCMAKGCGDCSNSRKFAKIRDKYNIMLSGC